MTQYEFYKTVATSEALKNSELASDQEAIVYATERYEHARAAQEEKAAEYEAISNIAMEMLHETEIVTASSLGERANCSTPKATIALKNLVNLGFVTVKEAVPSPKGKGFCKGYSIAE